MKKIWTLGSPNKRTQFEYSGSIQEGATINFSGNPTISPDLFQAITQQFSGRSIRGGFSMTSPTTGGLGEWIQDNSSQYGRKLTPRHALFIAAIMVHENLITSSLKGNAVILHFKGINDEKPGGARDNY